MSKPKTYKSHAEPLAISRLEMERPREELPLREENQHNTLMMLKKLLWRYVDEWLIDEIYFKGYSAGLRDMDRMHAKIDNQLEKNEKTKVQGMG